MSNVLDLPLLRLLAWNGILGAVPLAEELRVDLPLAATPAELTDTLGTLVARGRIMERRGRFALPAFAGIFEERGARRRFFPRKWAKIRRLARLLRHVPTVRFAAVCNTTAFTVPRDQADIDLFLVVRRGTVWLTRFLLAGSAALVGRRPGERAGERDAWCFSFIIDDRDLGLERFACPDGDPYLRFWTRRLLPILDDGIGEALWAANRWAWDGEPNACRWLAWEAVPSRAAPVASFWRMLDGYAGRCQRRFGSARLRAAALRPETDVVLESGVFKAHLDDRRVAFRQAYAEFCQRLDASS